MLNQSIIPFHDDEILLFERDGEPFVPVKPICERLGLDWGSQWAKLRARPERYGIVILRTPSAGGEQETTCLPLRKLPAWLYSIHPNKVRPDLKETVERYQAECDDVLWRHWSGQHRTELALLRRFNRHLTTQLLVSKPLWNRIMRLHEAGYWWATIQRLVNQSDPRFTAEWEALQNCGLVPDHVGQPDRQLNLALAEMRAEADNG